MIKAKIAEITPKIELVGSEDANEGKNRENRENLDKLMIPDLKASRDSYDGTSEDGLTVLLQRPFTIPFQSIGCTIQIAVRLEGSPAHELVVRALSNSSPRVTYHERVVSIDDVYSLLSDEASSSSMIQAATDSGDLVSSGPC